MGAAAGPIGPVREHVDLAEQRRGGSVAPGLQCFELLHGFGRELAAVLAGHGGDRRRNLDVLGERGRTGAARGKDQTGKPHKTTPSPASFTISRGKAMAGPGYAFKRVAFRRSEEHTSELQSLAY